MHILSLIHISSLPEFANSTDYARMKNIYMGNTIYTDEEIRKFADGSDPERYPNTDWYKEMLSKNAVQHQHNITVDGGRDNIKFFTSFGYVHQDGLWDNLNYERYSLRSNIDVKITSTTQLSVDASGRVEYRHGSPQSSTNVVSYTHLLPWCPPLPQRSRRDGTRDFHAPGNLERESTHYSS